MTIDISKETYQKVFDMAWDDDSRFRDDARKEILDSLNAGLDNTKTKLSELKMKRKEIDNKLKRDWEEMSKEEIEHYQSIRTHLSNRILRGKKKYTVIDQILHKYQKLWNGSDSNVQVDAARTDITWLWRAFVELKTVSEIMNTEVEYSCLKQLQ